LERRLKRGEIKAAVVTPAGFMDDVVAGRETSVQVLIDGTAPNTANYTTAHVVGFTQSMAAEVLRRNLARLSSGSLNFQRVGLETVWPHMLALVLRRCLTAEKR